MIIYKCEKDNLVTETSACPVCGGRSDVWASHIYWCGNCGIPLYEETCSLCGGRGRRLTSDIRPVFPQERLLIELVLEKPFAYQEQSVWCGSGSRYYVNGKSVPFRIAALKDTDADRLREQYLRLAPSNDETFFNSMMERFVKANTARMESVTSEALDYIRGTAAGYGCGDMFVSFSGGKDSTVTASLAMRALQMPGLLHIFGDTTLEFPMTMEYVERYRRSHPGTPVISSRNREKDFYGLCRLVGPPSRVMRWCCTVFKTGAIQRKIRTLFRDKKRILTFYGIRRSESAGRKKYERESDSPKITKQVTVSPIIDWLDFDVWLYLMSTGIDFNDAYRLGYARVGCWCCPNNTGWSEFLSRVHMPEQTACFREMLLDFARSTGKMNPESYVDRGSWKARQGGNGVEYSERSFLSYTPCALEENTYNYELAKPIQETLYELFRPFGCLNFELGNRRLGEVYVTDVHGRPVLRLQGRKGEKGLRVTVLDYRAMRAQSMRAAEEKVRCQLTKYQMCMGCLACESVCRHNAASVRCENGAAVYAIDDGKCVRCGECVSHFEGGCYMRKVLTVRRTEREKRGNGRNTDE